MNNVKDIINLIINASVMSIEEQLLETYRHEADVTLAEMDKCARAYYKRYPNQEEFAHNQLNIIECSLMVERLIERKEIIELDCFIRVMEKEAYRMRLMTPRRR
jgi:hypothetical protein